MEGEEAVVVEEEQGVVVMEELGTLRREVCKVVGVEEAPCEKVVLGVALLLLLTTLTLLICCCCCCYRRGWALQFWKALFKWVS